MGGFFCARKRDAERLTGGLGIDHFQVKDVAGAIEGCGEKEGVDGFGLQTCRGVSCGELAQLSGHVLRRQRDDLIAEMGAE